MPPPTITKLCYLPQVQSPKTGLCSLQARGKPWRAACPLERSLPWEKVQLHFWQLTNIFQ